MSVHRWSLSASSSGSLLHPLHTQAAVVQGLSNFTDLQSPSISNQHHDHMSVPMCFLPPEHTTHTQLKRKTHEAMLYFKNWRGDKKKKTGKFHSPLKDCHAYFEKRQYEKWSQDLGSYRNGFESQGSYLLCASYPRNLSIPQLQNESNGNFIAGDSCRVKWRQICENAQGMTDRTIVSST